MRVLFSLVCAYNGVIVYRGFTILVVKKCETLNVDKKDVSLDILRGSLKTYWALILLARFSKLKILTIDFMIVVITLRRRNVDSLIR